MGFYVQCYDDQGVIVGVARADDEQRAHHAFISLCCSEDRVVAFVKLFMEGDPCPLVWAYRNHCNMRDLITKPVLSRRMH